LAVLLGSLLDKYEPEEAARVAHLMAFVVGTISFIFGAVRFGFMHNVISRCVLLYYFISKLALACCATVVRKFNPNYGF
jgi:MFS superfamily sulfate permease-like transporter